MKNHRLFVPPSEWTPEMQSYAHFVERIARCVVNSAVKVQYIDDDEGGIQHCSDWQEGRITVNLAAHDLHNSMDNYELLIHALAHNALSNDDHLDKTFYEMTVEMGAHLSILALTEPWAFDMG